MDWEIVVWCDINLVTWNYLSMIKRDVFTERIIEGVEFILSSQGFLVGKKASDGLGARFAEFGRRTTSGQLDHESPVMSGVGALEIRDDLIVVHGSWRVWDLV